MGLLVGAGSALAEQTIFPNVSATPPGGAVVGHETTAAVGVGAGPSDPDPTGLVVLGVWSDSDCSGSPELMDIGALEPFGGGASVAFISFTPTAAGTSSVKATYDGDSNYFKGSSGCSRFTVSQATPSIHTFQQPASATDGASIADRANVSGGDQPSGTVTFSLYNNSSASGTPLFTDTEDLVGGVATSAGYTTTAPGTDYWVATYNGDTDNKSVTSGAGREPVTIAPNANDLAMTLADNSMGVGPGNALASKAAAIQTAVNANRTATACAGITDYLGLVNAQTGKKLTSAQAAMLTTDANNLATALGC